MLLSDLRSHAARLTQHSLQELAEKRSGEARLAAAGWTINVSRQWLDEASALALDALAGTMKLEDALSRLFDGETVNPSENRPALHWALRSPARLDAEAARVRRSRDAAMLFARDVRASGRYDAVVHIGIGGSDFGPRLLADAFADRRTPDIALHFVANMDPFDLTRALSGCSPSRTLVIGVSKSFATEETLYNLERARTWLEKGPEGHGGQGGLGRAWSRNIALVTGNQPAAAAWLGQDGETRIFDLPSSVGGRFSLWSAASLCCMIALGPDLFEQFLAGAHAMDSHVRTVARHDNPAIRLALLDYWNASVRNRPMRVVLAYASRLRLLPVYLQQLEMESNGKSVRPDGAAVSTPTAPALWGGEGSVGQHSYHQWLHQGSHAVPAEFIIAPDDDAEPSGRIALIAHALAQAELLANGRSEDDIAREEPGVSGVLRRQKQHAGGRPSVIWYHPHFGPEALGSLLALYEHRTYLAGCLWQVNSFDQWGVERGKTMAGRIASACRGEASAHDPVTRDLLSMIGPLPSADV